MNTPATKKITGVALAFAAAALVGCNSTNDAADDSGAAMKAASTSDMVHCYSVNQCKGHNDCGGADNSCKGQGSCKGKGFVAMPSQSCTDIGGKVSKEWTGTTATADLSHCYGVNVCKGHNACKTAENACKGHAVCKGHGFVLMGASACSDVGGKDQA